MLVYTYYEPMNGQDRQRREEDLLDLWKKSWAALKYTPIVLTEAHARRHPLYNEFRAKVDSFPSVNTREYERACYLRWLAIQANGGGLMLDMDVFNMSGEDSYHLGKRLRAPISFLEVSRVPCAVFGTSQGYDQWIKFMMNYKPKPGEKHVSDMTIAQETEFPTEGICSEIQPGWYKDGNVEFPLCHFPNQAVHKLGWKGAKSDLVRKVLKDQREK